MLTIHVPAVRLWDSKLEEFSYTKEYTFIIEHSLISISKWESTWHIPFISDDKKTYEQTVDYVKCMTISQNVNPEAYKNLTKENLKEIGDYIQDPRTATWFSKPKQKPKPGKKEVTTSELIYYWMVALEIPFECQKWHLNRLLTLIKVCNAKAKSANTKSSKGDKKKILANNAELNAARRKSLKTSG